MIGFIIRDIMDRCGVEWWEAEFDFPAPSTSASSRTVGDRYGLRIFYRGGCGVREALAAAGLEANP